MKKQISILLCIILMATSTLVLPVSAFAENENRIAIHDPSIYKGNDGKYYVVGSHLAIGESDDLINFKNLGHSMDGYNYLTLGDKSWKENLAEPLDWTSSYQNWHIKDRQTKIENDERDWEGKPYQESPYVKNFEYNCWANDVIYNKHMKKYCMYGCCSVWGTTASVIWLATSDCPTGPFEYKKSFIYSGITNALTPDAINYNGLPYTITNVKTDIIDGGYIRQSNIFRQPWFVTDKNHWNYNGYACGWGDYPNAIDPTAFVDKDGEMWLVYGSFSGGCFVIKLNNNTGTPDYDYMNARVDKGYDVYFGKQISKTNADTEGTGEGPFIVYDSLNDYYYYFLTYGGLASDGGYNIREYRSKNPDGPYFDAAGFNALEQKNTGLRLLGNYKLPSIENAYLSGGHSSCLIDDDGTAYQVYHTRFDNKYSTNTEGFQTVVHKMQRTNDGWLLLEPYEYSGDKEISKISANDIVGEYAFVNNTNQHARKESWQSPNSEIILPEQNISINEDGTISGAKDYIFSITNTNLGYKEVSGTWSLAENSVNATFTIGDVSYNVVFTVQKDEAKDGQSHIVFTGFASNNASIWGVKTGEHNLSTRITKQPTCKDFGIKTIVCSNCGYSYNQNIPKLNHKPATKAAVKATYFASGKSAYQYCTVCKSNITTPKTVKQLVLAKPVVKLAAGKKQIKASWSKNANASGYQIRYSLYSNMKSSKTVTIKSNKTVSYVIKKLATKKKYYVQVRSYKSAKGKKNSI